MPVTLVATPGDPSANSYLTAEEAATLVNERLQRAAWDGASADDRARALIEATRAIDGLRFRSRKVYPTQRLQFPRVDQEEALTVIPEDVRQAVVDQALAVLAPPQDVDRAALRAQGVKAFQVGQYSETFGDGGGGLLPHNGLCPRAASRLRYWVDRGGSIIGPRETPAGWRQRGWGPW